MRWLLSIILILAICLLAGCTQTAPTSEVAASPIPTETLSAVASTEQPSEAVSTEPSPSFAAVSVPDFEVELVAKVLRGECFDEQTNDKREVVKVICNRVATGFGDSIEKVITAPKQFVGYRPDNEPTDNDYAVAREVLTEWYESGCASLGEYLYFSSGSGHKNVFRKEWKEAS
jgi:hypothetical protein